jgi:CheY-like chemotaxis protein
MPAVTGRSRTWWHHDLGAAAAPALLREGWHVLIKNDVSKKTLQILVVDDEPDVREVFRLALKRKGHEVTLAETGESAIAQAGESQFDLAFIDVAMPGMDGVETVRQLKAVSPETPVVMITGFVGGTLAADERQDRVADALALGARGCLRKPFGVETILKTVEYFAR